MVVAGVAIIPTYELADDGTVVDWLLPIVRGGLDSLDIACEDNEALRTHCTLQWCCLGQVKFLRARMVTKRDMFVARLTTLAQRALCTALGEGREPDETQVEDLADAITVQVEEKLTATVDSRTQPPRPLRHRRPSTTRTSRRSRHASRCSRRTNCCTIPSRCSSPSCGRAPTRWASTAHRCSRGGR